MDFLKLLEPLTVLASKNIQDLTCVESKLTRVKLSQNPSDLGPRYFTVAGGFSEHVILRWSASFGNRLNLL